MLCILKLHEVATHSSGVKLVLTNTNFYYKIFFWLLWPTLQACSSAGIDDSSSDLDVHLIIVGHLYQLSTL